jgi:hypothetical protein
MEVGELFEPCLAEIFMRRETAQGLEAFGEVAARQKVGEVRV